MAIPVKWFDSTMEGAPVVSNNWGDLVALLDACLVTGFNTKAVGGITSAAGVATVTIPTGHKYKTNQVVLITGCDQPEYNGEHRVDIVSPNTFTFAVDGTPASPATTKVNITCKAAPLNWEKVFSAENKGAYRSKDNTQHRNILRVDNSLKDPARAGWAKWANVGIVENMTDIDTMVGQQLPWTLNNPNQNWDKNGWVKWYYARRNGREDGGDGGYGSRKWVIVGDDKLFYFFTTFAPDYQWSGMAAYCFGDPISFKPSDVYGTIISYHDSRGTSNYYDYSNNNYGGHINIHGNFVGKGIMRDHTNFGTGIRWCPVAIGGGVSGTDNMPFPNMPDYSLWMVPAYLLQEDKNIRGMLPGYRWLMQSVPHDNLSFLENVAGEPDKKFLLVKHNFNNLVEGAAIAFDITGPWR